MKNNEHKEKVEMAKQVAKLLPETKEKIKFYSDVIDAEKTLISEYEKRQSNFFVSKINKAKEKIELVKLHSGLYSKERIYQSYLERKLQYESWLDEMAIEVQNEFENTMNEAKEIKSNLRLQQAIEKFEQFEGKNTLQDRVEFYLYLNQEIINNKTFGKGKK
jgi:hypothetical protein